VLDVATGVDIALAARQRVAPAVPDRRLQLLEGPRAPNFKAAYTRGTQNANFFTLPTFPGNTRSSLDARVDTTLLQAGFTSRPTRELSFLGDLRYEDRDDKTPHVQFLPPSTGRDGFNTPFSRTPRRPRRGGLPAAQDIRLIGGIGLREEEAFGAVGPSGQLARRQRRDDAAAGSPTQTCPKRSTARSPTSIPCATARTSCRPTTTRPSTWSTPCTSPTAIATSCA
jgi:hypothetical protein